MAGLGYVALHKKDYQQAEMRLREAADSTTEHKREQWLKDIENIGYYSSLDTIKQLTRNKQYDQAFAFIDRAPANSLQQQLTLDLLRGQIYRDQKTMRVQSLSIKNSIKNIPTIGGQRTTSLVICRSFKKIYRN